MENLKMHTPDLADENFKKLAALFPNAVTETKDENGNVVRAIDADVLRQEISATVVEGPQERYQFTWPDKKKSVVLANQPIAKTLRLDREKSVGKDGTPGNIDTENIYIEGDNLDALKLLQETYLGKVKMIYIDPPYNTGNDFIYEDDFSQDADDYLGNSGQFDEEGNRLVQNTESNGRFHTDWLNMMYPRLRLAKDLLTKDGVIFISIDDNEVDNLKKMCNEILGAGNFEGHIHWRRRHNQPNDKTKMIGLVAEHILVYAKNSMYLKSVGVGKLDVTASFTNPDNDPNGHGLVSLGKLAQISPVVITLLLLHPEKLLRVTGWVMKALTTVFLMKEEFISLKMVMECLEKNTINLNEKKKDNVRLIGGLTISLDIIKVLMIV